MALRNCPEGHTFDKTSDCPTCPVCERQRQPASDFLTVLAAPARRALENAGIASLEQLAAYSTKELLQLHGLGKSSIPKLEAVLLANGLNFKTRKND